MSSWNAGDDVERRLIESIKVIWSGRKQHEVVLAGGDDCAIVTHSDQREEVLLTTDQVVEGTHFLRDKHPPEALGFKTLVRSLSDIAAMGGRPRHFLLSLCLPQWSLGAWIDAFLKGMRRAADGPQLQELALIGGDMAHGEQFVASVFMTGCVESSTAMRRDGAKPGDVLCVSGTIGGCLQGLNLLLQEKDPEPEHPALKRHYSPEPRLELGRLLRQVPASSAIDLSDGLATDSNRLAEASAVAVVINPAKVPCFPNSVIEDALVSGEEYELLFTLAPEKRLPAGLDVTSIGRIEQGSGVWLEYPHKRERLSRQGFRHF